MIGIGAQSGHGKTAFGLWVLKQYEKLNPVLLPLEQSSEELIEQRLENKQFIPNYLSPKKHSAHVTPDWIEERIVEAIAKHNSKLIMIDHMGYIEVGEDYRREGEHLRIEKKLQAIKHLAIKWNVVIVILIQLQQMEEEQAPSLRDLKGSSAIRQECDKILFLWRNNTRAGKARAYDNKVLISQQKNRFNGLNGNVGAEFETKSGEYLVTPESLEWGNNLEKKAKEDVKADNAF
jgi:replicative DNA helicase